ncbi:MAG TPA: UxaA family hydrolase [Acidobacteriaceae bacterium]|nr:UxaA family hydrolase [Terriglobia bacterium]HVC90542.1 UxaA family hydrolase [Acidobacteriaceae bacterium]
MAKHKIFAFRRENGRVGVRNHVIILPVDDISNAACEAVASHIKGTLALPHAYGRLQFGEDLDLFFRTMIGTGSNPNVAAVVVIGIEAGWTQRIVDGIAKTGKPVAGFSIEGKGDIRTIAEASYKAKEFVQWATELQRTECDLSELYISVKCGESDTTTGLASCPTVGNVLDKHCAAGGIASFGETTELTGAEHIVAAKAANEAVRKEFMAAFDDYTKLVFSQKKDDLSESQPTKGNIAGGLTTIEEKAFGNVEKLGKRTKFVGCLQPAAAPTGAGMWFMDTSSAAAEAVTLWAASGAVVHLFPTGQGNIIGNPIEPVIKLSGNPKTVATMKEHIDLDVSPILQGEMTLDQAGDALIELIARTANGRLTSAEALGHREYVLTKLYRSA